jgi:hypothetical protein
MYSGQISLELILGWGKNAYYSNFMGENAGREAIDASQSISWV